MDGKGKCANRLDKDSSMRMSHFKSKNNKGRGAKEKACYIEKEEVNTLYFFFYKN